MTSIISFAGRRARNYPRSLPISEWPKLDRRAWEEACRADSRLKPGGAASYLAPVSRDDFARRYGAFLGFLQRERQLAHDAAAAAQVTLPNVDAYITDLKSRVRSVTIWNCIYKLRRAAQLLAPTAEFSCLADIEKDLALEMQPRLKFERLVLSERLVEAGMTLIVEAEKFAANELARARGVRNGLMIALLALCPIRLKNFAALQIGYTFKEINGTWWIALPAQLTKSRRPDERRVPTVLDGSIELYLTRLRPLLVGSRLPSDALWISSSTGQRMTTKNLASLISKITLETIGVDVSPHLFRTAAASTAAAYANSTPHLASALLNHTDPRMTEEHYNRATAMTAATEYAKLVAEFRSE